MEEFYQHCIFVCSNYTSRKRKGLHFLYNPSNIKYVLEKANEYSSREGVSIYFVKTNSVTIESVQDKDSFFRNIDIMEGVDKKSVHIFDEALNNQINVVDIALLILSQKSMTINELKEKLFGCYCFYTIKHNSFPFREKFCIDPNNFGFKAINSMFEKRRIDNNHSIRCNDKINVVLSKFFNCDGGVELMNNIIQLLLEIDEEKELLIREKLSSLKEEQKPKNKNYRKDWNTNNFLTIRIIKRLFDTQSLAK